MISIIMPFFNHYDLVHKRFSEFYNFGFKDYEIVLINDASTDTGFEGNIFWWRDVSKAHLPIHYVVNEQNLGFIGSMNRGAQIALGNYLVFFSNDVVISGNFFPELLVLWEKNENCLIGNRLIDWDGGWNSFEYRGNKKIIPYLEGWFIACSKVIWNQLGGFDEQYAPSDYEDVDLSTFARFLGVPLVALNSPKLFHLGAQSYGYNAEREARTKQNREKFLTKWAETWNETSGV